MHNIPFKLFIRLRALKYDMLSTQNLYSGKPKKFQPLLVQGEGRIEISDNVHFGVRTSPGFWNGYAYLEARKSTSSVRIGSGSRINNNFSAIARSTTIEIGTNCLIGSNVVIFDSDFHHLNPADRFRSGKDVLDQPVEVGDNVFIGANSIILKGSKIGSGSALGAGSVVAGRFEEQRLIAGNPARELRLLSNEDLTDDAWR